MSTDTFDNETAAEATGDDEMEEETTGTGLDRNVAGVLAYLFGFVSGIVLFLIEDEDEFVRFHAAQSTIVFGGLLVLSIALSFASFFLDYIPVIGFLAGIGMSLFWLALTPVVFILWIVLMYKAYQGDRFSIPVVGEVAEQYV